ncbi:MAG: succinate dehydrogenase cytochrome b subunit, partial [Candidatus Cloacimonetes bacterium]|nr:succinate dehydrogenase cytochrome b subunit [Candidatus Cloacimonadota bacterium]
FRYLTSSIGKKQLMAVTGLMLYGFLITHLMGNFLLFLGPEKFNTYGHMLITNPLIIPMEIGLLSIFAIHIILAIMTTKGNADARPVSYAAPLCNKFTESKSQNMMLSGMAILVFLIVHIVGVKFGAHYTATYNGVEMRDLYKLLGEHFGNPIVSIYYILTMGVLGAHITHGFQSAFQTLGFNHKKYTPIIKATSFFLGWGLAIGYSAVVIVTAVKGAA